MYVKKNKKLLVSYIRNVIEGMSRSDVETSEDPLDWLTAAYQDPESWGAENQFDAMRVAANDIGLNHLGAGSSRIVYALDDDRVVKIAMNVPGLEQNKLEVFAGSDPNVESLLARVLDHDRDDYAWVVVERVDPLNDLDIKRAERLVGVEWSQVRSLFGLESRSEHDRTAPSKAGDSAGGPEISSSVGVGCLRGNEFLSAVKELANRYKDLLPGDFVKLSSWGVNHRGCLVLLDYGITKKSYDQYYSSGVVK